MAIATFAAVLALVTPMPIAAVTDPVVTGVWSDGRATLTLTTSGGTLVEDCQTATLAGPLRRRVDGRFDVAAKREHHLGGPQRADVPPDFIDIVLTGQVTDGALRLEVAAPGAARQRMTLSPGRRRKGTPCL